MPNDPQSGPRRAASLGTRLWDHARSGEAACQQNWKEPGKVERSGPYLKSSLAVPICVGGETSLEIHNLRARADERFTGGSIVQRYTTAAPRLTINFFQKEVTQK